MPDIMITIDRADSPGEVPPQGELRFECRAWHSQGLFVPFNAYALYTNTPQQIETIIANVAVGACALEGVIVSGGDKKLLIGSIKAV